MKKFLLIIFSLCLVMFPNYFVAMEIKSLNLEEALKSEGIEPLFDEYKEDDSQAIVYLFRGTGETKSVDFLNYLNSIYNEYGSFFKVKTYEVGSNPENSKLMDNVIDYMNSDVTTVPFIVIGDVQFTTYNKDDEIINENILKAIVSSYENGNPVDNIEDVLVKYYRNYDLMISIIIIIILALVAGMVYASVKGKK